MYMINIWIYNKLYNNIIINTTTYFQYKYLLMEMNFITLIIINKFNKYKEIVIYNINNNYK